MLQKLLIRSRVVCVHRFFFTVSAFSRKYYPKRLKGLCYAIYTTEGKQPYTKVQQGHLGSSRVRKLLITSRAP